MLPLASPGPSRTADFAASLRTRILAGQKLPGERLRLEALQREFGISLSPIREGLSRLVEQGLLVPVGQRGYRVAPVSASEFVDIQTRRVELELQALRQSIRAGDEDWQVALGAAFTRLTNFEKRRWQADELPTWEARHHAFHHLLISACGSPILMRFCETLHDMADRYRRVFLKASEPDRDVVGEHREMCEAALEGDADRACAILQGHIERTGANVLRVMERTASAPVALELPR